MTIALLAPDGGLTLALARAASVAAMLSVLGTLTFRCVVLARAQASIPPDAKAAIRRRLGRMAQSGVAAFFAASAAWLALQAADLADAATTTRALAAVPAVIAGTRFGHVLMLQAGCMAAAAVALRVERGSRPRIALGFAAAATVLHAGHSHAASMYDGPSFLLVSDVVHLLAAGAWLGGLAPLLIVVRDAPPRAGAAAARWFSPLGKLCVAALAASALFQGWVLVAGIPGLVGTAYGRLVLIKLALFGILFAFAWFNRYRFAPALLGGETDAAQRTLVRSIAVQTGFGLAVIVAAALLAGAEPSMHAQAYWPFSWRFSLDTVREDADFKREAIGAALAMGGAAALLVVAALVRRRARLAAAAAACGIAWLAAPHLDLLFVQAYPTSFARSPTMFAADSIAEGAALYPQRCASCHGAQGRGDGPLARGLPVPPADLTAAHLWMHSDGEMLWWLSHGIEGPDGRLVMPGFAETLSEEQRWNLIDAVRARNAGLAFASAHAWPVPVQAPDFQMICDGRTTLLSDLRGAAVLVTITPGGAAVRQGARVCVADDGSVPTAYALVTGAAADAVAGAALLIDGDGYLREARPPGDPGWGDPARLAAEMARIEANRLAPAAPAPMDMSGGGMHM